MYTSEKKKIMISQPMRGKSEEQIKPLQELLMEE